MQVSYAPDAGARWELPDDLRLRLLAILSADPTRRPRISYEEFLDWADEDTHAEWVDGRVVMTSPANLKHQRIVLFLSSVFDAFVSMHKLGRVVIAPFQMRLPTSGREPDVLFVATAHLDRLRATYLDGPADLVVEVISPDSRARDRGDKFYEYQEGGVPEYWLLDPDGQRAEFYQLDATGQYAMVPPDDTGVYHSRALPGFWLREAWLWEDPMPSTNRVMLAIEGDAYLDHLHTERMEAGSTT
jgi:Uma2 family endonuclease